MEPSAIQCAAMGRAFEDRFASQALISANGHVVLRNCALETSLEGSDCFDCLSAGAQSRQSLLTVAIKSSCLLGAVWFHVHVLEPGTVA